MTLQELGTKLEELENARKVAERELIALRGHQQRVEELEKDRDALLQSMSDMVLSTLDDLTGEEKNRLYQMLRVEVTPSEEGYEVNGAFCTSGLMFHLARRKSLKAISPFSKYSLLPGARNLCRISIWKD